MTLTTASPETGLPPRLRLGRMDSGRTLLDGAWWPRSTDPAAEIPELVLAIDGLRGRITRLALHSTDWKPHPHRLPIDGRILRLGFFASQPSCLLTARCDDGGRVDLLVVPPDTTDWIADAAMELAATTTNRIHANRLLEAAAGNVEGRTEVAAGKPKSDRKATT